MDLKCVSPGCGCTDAYIVRPVFRFRREFVWWKFWRGVHLVRKLAGYAAVCTQCDTSQVVTLGESYATYAQAVKNRLAAQGYANGGPGGSPDDDEPRPRTLRP